VSAECGARSAESLGSAEERHPRVESNGAPPRLLILGLGNDILTDDAIGLRVVRGLRPELADLPAIELQETTEMGLALLDYMTGYFAAFIVDSIQTGQAEPGFIHELDASALRRLTGGSPHFLGVGETLALGGKLGLPMPGEVRIFAIETQDPFTLGTRMTPALEGVLPAIVGRIGQAARAADPSGHSQGNTLGRPAPQYTPAP
jgi:hydrogenase maturation protease